MYGAPCINIATNDPDVAALYRPCLDQMCMDNTAMQTAYTALMGLIGIYGVIRQQEALEDQIALQERLVEQGQDYLDLAIRNYEEITLATFNEITKPAFEEITKPAFECQKTLFDAYEAEMRDYEIDFLACTVEEDKTYEPDYKAARGRAMSAVGGAFAKARRNASRSRSPYASGQCCAQDTMFAIEEAKAKARAGNEAYRYEDAIKFERDQWLFSRRAAGADYVAGVRANVISGVNGGVAGVNAGVSSVTNGVNSAANALNGIGTALSQVQNAASGLSSAFGNQASFFGNLSNGAFQAIGFQAGYGGQGNAFSGGQGLFGGLSGFGGFGGQGGGILGQSGGGYYYGVPGGGSFTGGSGGGLGGYIY